MVRVKGLRMVRTGFSLLAPPQVVSEEGTRYLSCSSGRSFRSVRERWWYIALSKCGVRGCAGHLALFLFAFLPTPLLLRALLRPPHSLPTGRWAAAGVRDGPHQWQVLLDAPLLG